MFATNCGIAASNFLRMLKGKQKITTRTLYLILKACPFLSRDWLFGGVGEMKKPDFTGNLQMIDSISVGSNTNFNDNSSEVLMKALDEIAAQRRLTEKAQSQIDDLISILKNK